MDNPKNTGNRMADRMIMATRGTDRKRMWAAMGGVRRSLSAVVILVILCIIWYIMAHRVDAPFIFPYFEDVANELVYSLTDVYILTNLAITMRRVLTGALIAFLVGFPLGLMMGFSNKVLNAISPFINSLRQIPIMAWVPLSIVWFGIGDGPTIFLIAFSGIFTIILNTIAGVNDIDRDYYNAARSMGASTFGLIKDVVLPGAMPGVITGVRLAIGMGWMSVIWAEFIATSAGFGYCMVEAQTRMQTEKVIAFMIIAGLIGFLIDVVMLIAERAILRWKGWSYRK